MALPIRLGAVAPRRRRGPRSGEGWWALLFLAPTLIGLALLSAGPILASFGISLTKWDLLTPPQFVGLDNFTNLLNDERFTVSLRNTAFYVLLSVPIASLVVTIVDVVVRKQDPAEAEVPTVIFSASDAET